MSPVELQAEVRQAFEVYRARFGFSQASFAKVQAMLTVHRQNRPSAPIWRGYVVGSTALLAVTPEFQQDYLSAVLELVGQQQAGIERVLVCLDGLVQAKAWMYLGFELIAPAALTRLLPMNTLTTTTTTTDSNNADTFDAKRLPAGLWMGLDQI